MNPQFVLFAIASYLIGSIPFGVLMAKAHGKDLRKIGSGNIGATNVSRALGKKWAYACFALDTLKGLVPTLAFSFLIDQPPTMSQLIAWLIVGAAAIIGHIFPLYLKFKGGKGVSTSLGMVLGLFPYYTIAGAIAFAVWAISVLACKYVSLSSILAAIAFPLILIAEISFHGAWTFIALWPLVAVAFLMSSLVILRHVENIKRIIAGTESKIMQKKND